MKDNNVSRMPFLAVLLGTILAFAGLANASVSGQMPHKAKKRTFNTVVATEMGNVTLEPGNYEVKEVNSKSGTFLRFSRVTENYQATEGLPVYDWEVVAEVRCMVVPLASKTTQTEFLFASNTGQATGLEIRGSNVKYQF